MPDTHSDSKPEDGVNTSAGTAASPSDSSGSVREQRALPLWDLILLPLIAVLTVAILGGSSRLIADRETAQSKQVVGTCIQQTRCVSREAHRASLSNTGSTPAETAAHSTASRSRTASIELF